MTTAQVMKKWVSGPFAPTLEDQKKVVCLVREGVPVVAFNAVIHAMGIPKGQAFQILRIPDRSGARVKAKEVLSQKQSEALMRLVRIFSLAKDTLGSQEKAWRWLQKPNRALGGDVPESLLDTEVGAQMVSDVLGRIDHGVFS